MPAGRRSRACAPRLMARAGFSGPRTVFEGTHGLFHGFAQHDAGQLRRADRRFRHALGHRNAGLQALSVRDDDASLHRLRAAAGGAGRQGRTTSPRWCAMSARARCIACGSRSPPSSRPRTAMRASSRSPTASRPALVRGNVGLGDFTDAAVTDARGAERCRARCATASTRTTPIPNNFTGHIRAVLTRRPRDRGAPAAFARRRQRAADARRTSRRKFALNCRHGGWDAAPRERALTLAPDALRRAHRPTRSCEVKRDDHRELDGPRRASSPAPAATSAA